MNLLASNEIYLIEIIVAVTEIIGAFLLFGLLAYIMMRHKKLTSDEGESSGKSDKEPEIRYVYVSAPPPEGTVVYQNAPAQYAPPPPPQYEQPYAPPQEQYAQPYQQPQYEPQPEPDVPPVEAYEEPPIVAAAVAEDDDDDDDRTEVRVQMEGSVAHYFYTRYNRSFTAKMILGTDEAKRYYSELKNTLLSYGGVKSRISWKWDAFRLGRKTLAKLKFSGKSVAVCLALDPKQFEESKYSVKDLSEKTTYADTPTMYRVNNERRLRYARELIEMMMTAEGASGTEGAEVVDYAAQFPAEDKDALMQRNQIKVTTREETREIPPPPQE